MLGIELQKDYRRQVELEMLTCMISAQSGPIMWMPTTVSLSESTISFMKPRASLPDTVFFIGLLTFGIIRLM